MMAEFTIDDMINSALAGKPDTFRAAFDDVMVNKLASAIEDKKQEIAQTMFADEEPSDEYEEDEEDFELEDDEVDDGEETEEHSDEE